MPSPFPLLSRSKHKRLVPLAARLKAVFEAQEDLPRSGPVPVALRAEASRVFDGIDRLLPQEGMLEAAGRLRKSQKPQMFDLFYATLEAIGAIKDLTRLSKIRRDGTYPRARKEW